MDYEKLYKEALERAKSYHDDPNCRVSMKSTIEHIFLELAESEDERIRKAIIKHFKQEEDKFKGLTFNGYYYKDVYAWLEKQGEQKPVAWSDDDERMLDDIISHLESEHDIMPKCNTSQIKWLKSIRPAKQWKPTLEQMQALTEIINFLANNHSPHYNDYLYNILSNIRVQLKAL